MCVHAGASWQDRSCRDANPTNSQTPHGFVFIKKKNGAKSRWDTAESLTTGPDEDAHASQAKNLSTSATKLRGRPGPAVLLCNQRNPINLPAWRYKQHPLSFPPAPGIPWGLAIFGCLPAGCINLASEWPAASNQAINLASEKPAARGQNGEWGTICIPTLISRCNSRSR